MNEILEKLMFDKSKEQVSSLLQSIEEDVERESDPDKDHILEYAFLLNDLGRSCIELERKLYTSLSEKFSSDPEVWYLFSEFTLRTDNNISKSFEYARNAINILAERSETTSAFSKQYIELAIQLKEYALAKSELTRISTLLDLTPEQKAYFISSLTALEKAGYLPDDYRDAI